MKRFIVERVFAHGLVVPPGDAGRRTCASIVAVNAACGVTWLHAYVSVDSKKTFCVCDAETPDAIRRASERNGLPLGRITEVNRPVPFDGQA